MIYIQIDETKKVTLIHHMPFDEKQGFGKTKEELEQTGALVESIPEPYDFQDKFAVLYCNPETKELWYEYEDLPLTIEEQLAEKDAQILKLKEEQFKLQQATTENAKSQQELIELLMDMGVI